LNRERILVVDEISDTTEVLQAVLEPRGVTVNRVSRWDQTESPTVENRPAVVVYDAESLTDGALPAGGNWHGIPQVVIGTVRIVNSDKHQTTVPDAERRFLQKPFQFAELVQAIEALIAPRAA
jgi:DNA-binding response OmpR family regulator